MRRRSTVLASLILLLLLHAPCPARPPQRVEIPNFVQNPGFEDVAGSGPAGCVGYCMSGPFAFALAAAIPQRIAAAASFHGVRLCTEALDSPHLTAHEVRGELYFGCAETDEWAPAEMVEALDAHLASVGLRYRIETYPGTVHGFVFPQRPTAYQQAGAERHWERLFSLFRRRL